MASGIEKKFDVIVVGGGVNGTGVARDAAMRGFRVLLLDKRDVCSGATGTCSGMIHGGLRYLLNDVKVTKLSCLDSGYIQKIAPHMLFRIPFMMAVPKDHAVAKPYLELTEVFIEVYDKYQPLKNGQPHCRLSPEEAAALEPGLRKDIVGAITFDEWGIDPFRLCVANAKSAEEHGAVVKTYCEVLELLRGEGGEVEGVKCRDTITGQGMTFRGKIVVNTTGPWSMAFSQKIGAEVKLRPAKGVHLIYGRRLSNIAIVASAVDGRQLFLCPHQKGAILGTTDDDYYGDMDNVSVTEDDVQYLLQGMETIFPDIRRHRIIRAMAGVRPTLYEEHKYEDNLTREHMVFDHEKREGIKGLISLAGGKLASYRLMSQDCTDLICKKLELTPECRTHKEPLPGGDCALDTEELSREFGVPAFAVDRMFFRHGSRAVQILDIIKQDPRSGDLVCKCDPVTEAELRYSIRNEWVRKLSDLRRRNRLACGPCQGTRCAIKAAAVMAGELCLSADEMYAQAFDLLSDRWKGIRPILGGVQMQQEEMRMRSLFGVGRLQELLRQEKW